MFIVSGRIQFANGQPFAAGVVRAFRAALRGEGELAEGRTAAEGAYLIHYAPHAGREDRSFDLRVAAFGADGQELASSPIRFHASADETIDLVITAQAFRTPSEFERLVQDVTPHLGAVAIADLEETDRRRDATFLTLRTRHPADLIEMLIQAHRLARQAELPAEMFYGFLREGFSGDLPGILARGERAQRDALIRAIDRDVIPERMRRQIDDVLSRLGSLSERHLLDAAPDSDLRPLSRMLALTRLPKPAQADLLRRAAAHEGSPEEFWRGLRSQPDFQAHVDDTQFALQLGVLTQTHVPLGEELSRMRRSGEIRELRDLARLAADDWAALLDRRSGSATIGHPDDIPGTDAAEKRRNYAHGLRDMLAAAFPTAAIAGRFAKDGRPGSADVARFLERNRGLDFAATTVTRFLRDNPAALDDVADKPAFTRRLRTIERLFRVSPRFEHIRALEEARFDSALSIGRFPRETFARQFATALGGERDARAVHARAQSISGTLAHVYAGARQSAGEDLVRVIGRGIPNWEELFGALELCDCAHCRSVYSPAAYFVELLEFLAGSVILRSRTALGVLLERRPDLQDIALTCENTNTPLPYIDLVIEVLESYIDVRHTIASNTSPDATAEELSVLREHTNPLSGPAAAKAQDELRHAVYPFDLPFDRPLESSRAWLEHLRTSRHELMVAFRQPEETPDLAVAMELLGLSPAEGAIVTARPLNPARTLSEFYGFPPNAAAWQQELRKAPLFLERTGLTYIELQELCHATFIKPGSQLTIAVPPGADQCDLANTTVDGLDEGALSRIHRFVRLSRKLGWTSSELDTVLASLDAPDLDAATLAKLASIKQLLGDLNLPLRPLLSLWADIDTRGPDSLYERLFLNRTLRNPANEAFALVNGEIPTGRLLSEHVPSILAALGIGASELDTIREHHADLADPSAPLTVANLSRLFRFAVLARALRLSIRDLRSLLVVSGMDPFQSSSPDAAVAFVDIMRQVRGSGFTLAQIAYLCGLTPDPKQPVAPAASRVKQLFIEMRRGLEGILSETTFATNMDPDGERLRQSLGRVIDPLRVDETLAVIEGQDTGTESERAAFIDEHFAHFMDAEEAKATLLPALTGDAVAQDQLRRIRREAVLRPLLEFLQRTLSRSLVKHMLAEDLSLAPATVRLLIEGDDESPFVLRSTIDPSRAAIEDFLSLPSATSLPPVYRRLHKVALIVNGFTFSTGELRHVVQHPADFGGVALNEFPIEPGSVNPSLFPQWMRLAALRTLTANLPRLETPIHEVFAQASQADATLEDVLTVVAAATGWDQAILTDLAGPEGFALSPEDFRNERWLVRLQACLQLLHRTGLPLSRVTELAGADVTAAQADGLMAAVRGKYDGPSWTAIAKPINDRLRERYRGALLAHALQLPEIRNRSIRTPAQLYEFFLIDCEMGACMDTSRIKQAISSVQLFVQRCFLNLEVEHGIEGDSLDAQRWRWMKNYRVWEANRKVFLYPENWIDPALRDDKSPFFKELEGQLLQAELTAATAEAAVHSYLEKLDQVAALDIVGMYWDEDSDAGSPRAPALHVFGRTLNTPAIYYYRRLDVVSGAWSGWERVNLDIAAEDGRTHLVPVVYQERLYLFWPVFEEKQEEQTQAEEQVETEAHKKWRVEHDAWEDTPEKKEHDGWERKVTAAEDIIWRGENKMLPGIPDGIVEGSLAEWEQQLEDLKGDEPPLDPEPQEPFPATRDANPPKRYWEIKMAWSEYRGRNWTAKQLSANVVTSRMVALAGKKGTLPPPNRHSLRVSTESPLTITVLVSRTEDRLNSYVSYATPVGEFTLDSARGQLHATPRTDSDYPATVTPEHCRLDGMMFSSEGGTTALALVSEEKGREPVLRDGESSFHILFPAQFEHVGLDPYYPFFYQNRRRTYCVTVDQGRTGISLRPSEDAWIRDAAMALSEPERMAPSSLVLERRQTARRVSPVPARQMTTRARVGMPRQTTRIGSRGSLPLRANRLPSTQLRFQNVRHPHVDSWFQAFANHGVAGLLTLANQRAGDRDRVSSLFERAYEPTAIVHRDFPTEAVDFDQDAAQSVYNWELFFIFHC